MDESLFEVWFKVGPMMVKAEKMEFASKTNTVMWTTSDGRVFTVALGGLQ